MKLSKQFNTILIILLFSMASAYFFCDICRNNLFNYLVTFTYTSTLWMALWMGNSALSNYTDKYINWLENPLKRLVFGMISTALYTLLIVFLIHTVVQEVLNLQWSPEILRKNLLLSLLITLIISLFMHARSFLINWRRLEMNAIELKNENLNAKYQNLRNQINPHFLFNSFNSLTDLIYTDPDDAAKFVKHLSSLYRYVLDSQEKELVPLDQEIKFADSYLYLEKIRYGDNLQIIRNVANHSDKYIVPMALQLLIENAIKHNIITKDEPLSIWITSNKDSTISIVNSLNKKSVDNVSSTGIGLKNLITRYELLTDRKVVINDGPKEFSVIIPLLEIETYSE